MRGSRNDDVKIQNTHIQQTGNGSKNSSGNALRKIIKQLRTK